MKYLQNLCIRCLRVSKVHHLIQQLVTDDKVVPDALLLHLLEVLLHHLPDLVEEAEQQGHIGVGPGRGNDVDVAVLDVSEGAVIGFDQRSGQGLILNLID